MEMEPKSRKPMPMERRPRILKDFLRDDLSSCSSSGFRSLPRRSCYNTTTSIRCLIQKDLTTLNNKPTHQKNQKASKKAAILLSRSRSKAASSTVSALQKASEVVMNVVKHFQYFSSGKQGIFSRNLSRRLKRSFTKKSRSNQEKREISDAVKVRDIVRWRSFRDLTEEKQKPVIDDRFTASSPIHNTITTTTTTTTTANHSWSDSDFTVSEYLNSSSPSSDYSIENEAVVEDEKRITDRTVSRVGEQDSMDKGEFRIEKDQLSPVSVHDFPSEEDEETPSSFMSSLDKMERTKHKLMMKIRRFESLCQLEPVDLEKRIASFELNDSVSECCSNSFSIDDVEVDEEEKYEDECIKIEEKAQDLLQLLMQNRSGDGCKGSVHEPLLLDFFRESLNEREQILKKASKESDETDKEILLREAKEWMNGQYKTLDFGLEASREVHIKEMERGFGWNKFEEEQGEIALEMESEVFSWLMNELVLDLLH